MLRRASTRILVATALSLWALWAPPRSILSAQSPTVVHDQLLTKILVNPDVTATQTGHWSDPATWGGAVPTTRQRIVIPAGVTVTVDQEISTAYNWIRYDGTLRFKHDVNTKLIVETIGGMGRLEIGTAAQPIDANVMARLVFQTLGVPIEHAIGTETATYADPLELSRGLIAFSPVSIYGAAKMEISAIAGFPPAGATTLTLERDPTGWRTGDEMLVAPTLWGQDEVVTVTGINGRAVTFTPALKYTRQNVPQHEKVRVHVGNLTRNVIVQSSASDAGNRQLQGHVMLMGGGQQFHNAAFLDTGRTVIRDFYAKPGQTAQWNFTPVTDPIIMSDGTRNPQLFPPCGGIIENPRGRYSLHFHRAEPGSAESFAEGTVVRVQRFKGYKIGIQNHSSNVIARRNIVHQIDGGGLFTEVGDEQGIYDANMVVHALGGHAGSQSPDHGSDACLMNFSMTIWNLRPQGFGWKGALWLQGGNVPVTNNVFAGMDQAGIDHEAEGLGRRKTGVPQIRIRPDHLRLGFQWFLDYMLARFKVVVDPTVPVLVEREPVLQILDNHIYAIGATSTPPYVNNPRYTDKVGIKLGTGLELPDFAGYRPKNLIKGNLTWNTGSYSVSAAYSSYNRIEDHLDLPGVVPAGSSQSQSLCRGGINGATQNGKAWTFKNVLLNAGAVPNCGFAPLPPISVVENVTLNGKPYVPTIETCEDKIDNDNDGLVDEGCLAKEPEIVSPPDTTPPVATVTNVTSVSQTQHTIAVASNEPATATVTLDEETEPRCSGSTPLTCAITLTAWPRTATITVTDAAGNVAPPSAVTLTRPQGGLR